MSLQETATQTTTTAETTTTEAKPATVSTQQSNGSSMLSEGNSGGNGQEIEMSQDANGDWRATFATGLDDTTKETWGKLSSRYTSPTDMAKAHVELVRTMDKRIALPGPDAKPEEVDAVYQKLGMPETADKYQFKMEGIEHWDDERRTQVKELAPIFRQARATQEQVDLFVKHQAELDKAQADAFKAKADDIKRQNMKQLQTEWKGQDFERNKSLYQTTIRTYADAEQIQRLSNLMLADGTPAMDHPDLAKLFAKIGAERAEDDRDPTAFNAGLRESAQEQINQIEQEALSKGLSPTSPQWPHKKLDALYAKVAGSKNMFASH